MNLPNAEATHRSGGKPLAGPANDRRRWLPRERRARLGLRIWLLCFLALGIAAALPISAVAQEESLPAVKGEVFLAGQVTTFTSTATTALSTAPLTLSGAGPHQVLVVAAVSVESTKGVGNSRYAYLRIIDNGAGCPSPAQELKRYLSGTGDKDTGIVVLTALCSYGAGPVTYSLQHRVTKPDGTAPGSNSYEIGTHGTIVAVPLSTSPDNRKLNSAFAQTAGPVATIASPASVWSTVGPALSLNLPAEGGLYVIATFNQIRDPGGVPGTDITASYQLEYCIGAAPCSPWIALSPVIDNEVEELGDFSTANLAGLLENQSPGAYQFRLRHKDDVDGTSAYTGNVSMVAVALGIVDNTVPRSFDTYQAGSGGVSTASATPSPVQEATVTVENDTRLFVHSFFNASSTQEIYPPAQFFQTVSGSKLIGNPLYRYMDAGGDSGNSGAVNITDGVLLQNTAYDVTLQHASDGTGTITTTGVLSGFALTTDSIVTITHTQVIDFEAEALPGGGARVAWQTTTETGTAGFHIERREQGSPHYERINDELLPALAFAPLGGVYEYIDGATLSGKSYEYRVVEVEADGDEHSHGPFRAVLDASMSKGAGQAGVISQLSANGKGRPIFQSTALPTNGNAIEAVEPSITQRVQQLALQRLQRLRAPTDSARLKIATTEQGLHYLDADDIAGQLSTDPHIVRRYIARGLLSVTHHGSPVAYLPTPNNRGLHFYAEKIDDIHTSENIYWLSVGSGQVMPREIVSSAGDDSSDAQAAFRESRHVETERYYRPSLHTDPEADVWLWGSLVGGREPGTFNLPTPGAASTGQGELKTHLYGGTDLAEGDDHHVEIRLNGVPLGETRWGGIVPHQFSLAFDQSLLLDGDNEVEIKALKDPGVPFSWVFLDDFDIEYERRFEALDDQLSFKAEAGGSVTISGFGSADIALFDISDPLQPAELHGARIDQADDGSYQLSFTPQPDGRSYLATARHLEPAWTSPTEQSNLIDGASGAEYLIISPAKLAPGAEALRLHKAQQYGTQVVLLEDIYDEFNHGIVNPGAIRAFLQAAYRQWPQPPKWVVLVGRGTLDPKDYLGKGDNRLPMLMVATPNGLSPSDFRYADLEGDDGVPEVALGRLPVTTSSELEDFVAKLAWYESAAAGDWSSRALMVADTPTPTSRFDGESDLAASALPIHFDVQRVYNQGNPAVTRQLLFEALNQDVALFNYIGHGDEFGLAGQVFFVDPLDPGAGDLWDLHQSDNGEFPLFMAFSCSVGNGSLPGFASLAERMVLHPSAGAIAAFAPTGLSSSNQAKDLNVYLIGALFPDDGGTITVGESIQTALGSLAEIGGSLYMRSIYAFYGDPAMRIKR